MLLRTSDTEPQQNMAALYSYPPKVFQIAAGTLGRGVSEAHVHKRARDTSVPQRLRSKSSRSGQLLAANGALPGPLSLLGHPGRSKNR